MDEHERAGGAGGGAEPSLLALMRAEFTVGKRWARASLACQVAAVIASTVGVVVTAEPLVWATILIALFALIAGYVFQLNAERAQALGERTRRAVMLRDGLGWEIGPRQEADLRLGFGPWANRIAERSPDPAASYFTSTAPAGPERLRDQLQESVFWHAHLSQRMAGYALGGVVAMGLVLLAAVLLALNSLDQHDARGAFAKALAGIIPFLVTTNVARLWWRFHQQEIALHQLDAELDATRTQLEPLGVTEVLRLAHEYDIQMVGAPQAPDLVYRLHEAELNERWAARVAGYPPGTVAAGGAAEGAS